MQGVGALASPETERAMRLPPRNRCPNQSCVAAPADRRIEVVLDTWLDHIPLERQARILDRHGLPVTWQTLWDPAYSVSKRLAIVDDALTGHVLAQTRMASWGTIVG